MGEVKDKILGILKEYTQEMEGYSYYGSNPGISEDDYDEIASKIELLTNPEPRHENQDKE
jgi:hypothetical protein